MGYGQECPYLKMELIGTICGIIGAFLVAGKIGTGYWFFLASSGFLLVSAIRKKQYNLVALQTVFVASNVFGLFNW